jgi:hypothetical protein
MRIKRRVLVVVLVALALSALPSCTLFGDKEESENKQQTEAQSTSSTPKTMKKASPSEEADALKSSEEGLSDAIGQNGILPEIEDAELTEEVISSSESLSESSQMGGDNAKTAEKLDDPKDGENAEHSDGAQNVGDKAGNSAGSGESTGDVTIINGDILLPEVP